MVSIPSRLQGKRVCFISPSAYPLLDPLAGGGWSGGAETQLITIGRAMSKAGFDVHFIVGDYGQPESVMFGEVTAHRSTFRHMGGSKFHFIPDMWRLFRLLRKIRADYCLIKVPPHLLPLLGLYCRTHGAKLIFIGQKDSDLDENRVRQRQGAPGWWLYRSGIGLTDFVVAQTETQRAGFRDKFGKDATVIRNVLTLEEDVAGDKEDYVLWVGNNNDDKQAHLVPELALALPDIRFRMIMAFDSSRRGDSFIRDQLDKLPNLEYLGTVPFSEIANHYKRARLFISTSKCEGFPNTFLQSWQYRTPVISLMVDPDGVIGLHDLGRVSGSLDNMVRQIQELHSNTELREKLGDNARRYAYEHHSLESAVKKYCGLLADIDAKR